MAKEEEKKRRKPVCAGDVCSGRHGSWQVPHLQVTGAQPPAGCTTTPYQQSTKCISEKIASLTLLLFFILLGHFFSFYCIVASLRKVSHLRHLTRFLPLAGPSRTAILGPCASLSTPCPEVASDKTPSSLRVASSPIPCLCPNRTDTILST